MKNLPPAVQEYIDLVEGGTVPVCQEQKQLVAQVRHAFETEEIYIDTEQLGRYLSNQKYFPYRLLPWEVFIFALHNCAYRAPGALRWPILFVEVGRGAGKNGYLAFEDFSLLTPINGVKEYHIDIFANAEDQARATFDDIYNILEGNSRFFKKYFEWTKEIIKNKTTKSALRYHTSAPKTKDGGRPGKVDFDEVHNFLNENLIDVAVTGLGKKPMPRRTFITTQGNVRGAVLDKYEERGRKVLAGSLPDNGWLYFIARLDSDAEIMDPTQWPKANPSLLDKTRPQLLQEIMLEFAEYQEDPAGHLAFATKRMNRPLGNQETEITAWENILAACRPIPESVDLERHPCVFGVDYANTQDFIAAGILWRIGGVWYWKTHTWVCRQSKGLARINFPLAEAEARGELTMVDAPEIPPETPVEWINEQAEKYNLFFGGIDRFRWTLLAKAFRNTGWNPDKDTGNIKLVWAAEISKIAPLITSAFLQQKVVWGDSMLMRWYTNNACRKVDGKGNISFEKIEPKSRKTDGFMAFVAAFVVAIMQENVFDAAELPADLPDVFVY